MNYYKIINGELIVRDNKNIIVYKNNKQIINPTQELIIKDGWQLYNEKSNNNDNELTIALNNLIDNILQYDKSKDVEIFYINDIALWLDRDERAILQRRFEIESKNNITTSTLWKDDNCFEININMGMNMLDQLELYAIKCFDVTHIHLNNVKKLKSIEDINAYDYSKGYPDKLYFSIK